MWTWWKRYLGCRPGNGYDDLGAIVMAALAIMLVGCLLGLSMVATAAGNPFPVPDRARDGDKAYCKVWSDFAVRQAAHYVRTPPEVRANGLVIIRQNREEDRLHPEAPDTMVIAGVEHPTAFILTQGQFANGIEWEADLELQDWVAQSMRDGWDWMDRKVKMEGASLDYMKILPVEMAQRFMYMECANLPKSST